MNSKLSAGDGGSEGKQESTELSAAALEAKRKTVEELKAFEASKAKANSSLAAKLDSFKASLANNEHSASVLGLLLVLCAASTPKPAEAQDAAFQPIQNDGTEAVSVFLKPMQRAEPVQDEIVFLKPMQRAAVSQDDVVFLKPMQRAVK
ncbi:hypothetical protein [Paraherbaspirillum soli]|uniref:Uncharacterized protein n=1 Tax=Paraherbaspirillum soli TaxID=631222 RepID=A0ABW0M552_9BURK